MQHPPVRVRCHDMKFKSLAALYGIVVGLMMFLQWIAFIALGEVDELETEPTRISFHLAAEFLTGAVLIVSGYALLKGRSWGFPVYLVAMGMLSYTIVVSPGYFAQDGDTMFVGMFAVLWLLTVAFLVTAIIKERELRDESTES